MTLSNVLGDPWYVFHLQNSQHQTTTSLWPKSLTFLISEAGSVEADKYFTQNLLEHIKRNYAGKTNLHNWRCHPCLPCLVTTGLLPLLLASLLLNLKNCWVRCLSPSKHSLTHSITKISTNISTCNIYETQMLVLQAWSH